MGENWSFAELLLVILTVWMLLFSSFGNQDSTNYRSWNDVTLNKFYHLAVHEYTGRVYIGAVNRIYQLSENLELEKTAVMGPMDDSEFCPASRVCPRVRKMPTYYHNKGVMVDYTNSRLIACGTLFQGACTLHDLNDVATYQTPANESVVANNAASSTVLFIAPGPEDLAQKDVLFAGVSYSGLGPYSEEVPAVSSRTLASTGIFRIANSNLFPYTKIYLNSLARETYPIKYVTGFSYRGFSYFVTNQKEHTRSEKPFISKLVRICQNDMHYYSYTEVSLVCENSDGTNYNLAQATHVANPGSELATSLGILETEKVLFVVFAKSTDKDDVYNKPSSNSALCVYSLPAINRKFTKNIQHCYTGQGKRGLDFITPSMGCLTTVQQIDDDFCGLDVNFPLDGSMPIQATPVLHFPGILLTSVAAASTNSYTVLFLGTSEGHLKKAVVESETKATEYGHVVIDDGSPVNADMLFDKTKNYVYVMTERKVTKVKVQECDTYHTCTDCLAARDPYCGWCSSQNKCSLREDCTTASPDPSHWLSYKTQQSIIAHCTIKPDSEDGSRTSGEGGTRCKQSSSRDSKVETLQDIAQSMRSIDSSLKELIRLQKQCK